MRNGWQQKHSITPAMKVSTPHFIPHPIPIWQAFIPIPMMPFSIVLSQHKQKAASINAAAHCPHSPTASLISVDDEQEKSPI